MVRMAMTVKAVVTSPPTTTPRGASQAVRIVVRTMEGDVRVEDVPMERGGVELPEPAAEWAVTCA